METIRINKLIAHSGLASRRTAEFWIETGRVTVNGAPARQGQQVDPQADEVAIDGVPLPVRPGLVYYLLNKPLDVVSTADDPQGRPTVVDLVPAEPRVYPVGRLDRDSGGLLLLTNDGDLTLLLTHPRYEVPKVYSVLVEGRPSPAVRSELLDGVELDDGSARAADVKVVAEKAESTLLEVTMLEGRHRIVRRMMEAVGHPVQDLFRKRIGPLADAELRSGDHRPLTIEEVRSLYGAAKGEA